MAWSFLQVHEQWLSQALGPLSLAPSSSSTTDVHLHIDHLDREIAGSSLGAALTGERERGQQEAA